MLPHSAAHSIPGFLALTAPGSPEACAALWTGRSAMSAVTESALSRFATSGSRCTRLSAMRLPLARVDRAVIGGVTRAGAHTQRRRVRRSAAA